MSGGYAVHIGELGKLITTLEEAADQITDANKTLSAVGELEGMMGNDRLASEAKGFDDTWEYGIEKLAEAASAVSERLLEAKKNYQALEEMTADAFGGTGGLGSEVPGGGWTGSFPTGPNISAPGGRAPGFDPSIDGPVGGGYTGGIGDVLGGGR
ncbi:MAG: WXG100 family type VII secretion target [Haloechinothrix sp.]